MISNDENHVIISVMGRNYDYHPDDHWTAIGTMIDHAPSYPW